MVLIPSQIQNFLVMTHAIVVDDIGDVKSRVLVDTDTGSSDVSSSLTSRIKIDQFLTNVNELKHSWIHSLM